MMVGLLLQSCSTPKNITYFQDVATGTIIDPAVQKDITIKPDDKLSIIVTTQDPALSQLFNLASSQNRLGQTTTATHSLRPSGTSDGYVSYYTVNPQGDINFPVIGKLHIAGMNRAQIAAYIEKELQQRNLVKDPVVTVEFINTGLSILGEVASPGRYEFNKDRMTIIEAIALAGDLTINGERENVLVMRKDADGKQQSYRVDLTDMQNLSSSPVYYLQQEDIIYVQPNDKRKRDTTSSGNAAYTPSFWVSVGSLGITVATLIVTLTK